MTLVRVFGISLLLVVAVGCGGKHATAPSTSTVAATPAAQRAEIKRVWEQFFAGSTSAMDKTALLENGSAFAKAIEAQASSALAKQSGAKVTSVTPTSKQKAAVVYTILLSGKPVLQHQHGTAVRVDGGWKVGQASFCRLLSLQGAAPQACNR